MNIELIISIMMISARALYLVSIYYWCEDLDTIPRVLITALSFPFPIIAGFIALFRAKDVSKDYRKCFSCFGLSVALYVVAIVIGIIAVVPKRLYYDKNGNKYVYSADVVFYDAENNEYTFDFDKSGYDYLYTAYGEKLDADWCYVDESGNLYYDDDMSIIADGEHACIDTDGKVYYPAKFTDFNREGEPEYSFNSSNFSYDRFGNAYTYHDVPYYDEEGNKYYYFFDSDSLKGYYINISTGERYENEKSFVDESGYLVCDENGELKKVSEQDDVYTDAEGNMYYWASGIDFDSDGNIVDI